MKHLVAAAPDPAYTVIVINRVFCSSLYILSNDANYANYQPLPPSRGQVPVQKAPPEPPTTPKRSSNRPPVPPDPAAKKRSRGSKDGGHEAADKGEDHDYRTATPQEVLE